ncbi:hypothetical protein CVT24_007968 [Panaeolus cyanescens]|uniref:U4/U6 snRNA-associated-splicing factor PRP24 n=1 Tax=Panaeolus cyanescens TaxID=181874 RepID=A0A409YQR8_9AGAR|nr:hypothetical protein CVT24_007968 [Panaeolus cyanescens]
MDESQSLDNLGNILEELSDKPLDPTVHARYIKHVQSVPEMQSELSQAREMMVQLLAAPDQVWLPLLKAAEEQDLETPEAAESLLSMYKRAESDYLSIPILQRHVELLVEQHEKYSTGEAMKPSELGDIFSTEWTRDAIHEVVEKSKIHLKQSSSLWELEKDWLMETLSNMPPAERQEWVEYVQQFFLTRLQEPHYNAEHTFQEYSTFTTNYLPPNQYETIMLSASKLKAQSVKFYERREGYESTLAQENNSLDAFNQYIGHERRVKNPDLLATQGIHERAIAAAARKRFEGEYGAEQYLRMFWISYVDALRNISPGIDIELQTYRRAARSIPGSGELWARYIRFLVRFKSVTWMFLDLPPRRNACGSVLDLPFILDIFGRAMDTKLIQTDAEQLVPLILARAGYEKRLLESGAQNEESLPTIIGVLETGIELTRQTPTPVDPKLRLEKFLASIYENSGLVDSVFGVWKSVSEKNKNSYQVWLLYTEALTKHQRFDEAREIFQNVHSKQLDWPEMVWEAWLSFEHVNGSLEDIENCMDKIERAQFQTQKKREREAAAAYEAMQVVPAVPQITVPEIQMQATVAEQSNSMEVDASQGDRGTKRSAEEEPAQDSHKKARFEPKPVAPKRDRENATVFCAELPGDVEEEDLKRLFHDCGEVREVKITRLPSDVVATVEFTDRDSVPAALTKDKKRVNGQEVAVHLAWKSTLYVTNFPETADDAYIRELFGKYGTIFDVRWPSKKFKSTRRFCYVQFTSPDAANRSLELHGRELEEGRDLNVYISNPERKKERTDVDIKESEVYIAGLSKFTTKADLEKVFKTYGRIKEVRLAVEENGNAKGFAFVQFEEPKDAQASLAANNHELKKRRIAVTLADNRVRARHKSDTGMSRAAETRTRSVYIKNLPPGTNDGLLQQALEKEKIVPIKRVEVFLDRQEAVVELENPADAGKLLLRSDTITLQDHTLKILEDIPVDLKTGATKSQDTGPTFFKPRHLGPSKPKAGLGFKKSTHDARPATSAAASTSTSTTESEYSESSSITFEWTLRGLRNLFESTKGDKKSKVTRSMRFGGNRWQILFYANAGQTKDSNGTDGGYVSLYLACEPTAEEKELALGNSGKWTREGVYKFSFELRNVGKTILYNTKEAHNHTFTFNTANWGWAQFAKRDSAFYQAPAVKNADAFVIVCTITAAPTVPTPFTIPKQPVPRVLLDTIGSLLDDPLYSDVKFVLPRPGQSLKEARTIWASRKVLERAEYFQSMFSSHFSEGCPHSVDINQTPRMTTQELGSQDGLLMQRFEDSDTEEEEEVFSPASSLEELPPAGILAQAEDSVAIGPDMQEAETSQVPVEHLPSSPQTTAQPLSEAQTQPLHHYNHTPKLTIVVRDVAYTTYRAMLYYLYTDNIVFAPLASTFLTVHHESSAVSLDGMVSTPAEINQTMTGKLFPPFEQARNRSEWIRDWMNDNPGRPAPCSAKAIYRLADRFDLAELKERAAQHIIKSLNVDNIAYEIFSPFAATFESIRKVEVEFFLAHWHEIRASQSMRNVWSQIRNGRHPGFEEGMIATLAWEGNPLTRF